MSSKLALIGMVLAAIAVIGFQATRGGLTSPATQPLAQTAPQSGPAEETGAPDTAQAPAPAPAEDPASALARADAERLRLEDALARAQDEAARLTDLLSARDAEPAAASGPDLKAALASRDAELARLNVALLAQSTEIARLRDDLAAREADLARILDEGEKLAALAQPAMAPARPPKQPLDEVLAALKGAPLPRPEGVAARASEGTGPVRPAAPAPLAEVHFDMGSATLSPGAEARARLAAAALLPMDVERIRVTGHSDTVGSGAANLALSRARAEAVADVLVAAGIPRDRLEIAAFGQDFDVLPFPTGTGVPEPLNRCVGIWPVAASN